MEFLQSIHDALKVVTFDEKKMADLSKDKNALLNGFIILIAVTLFIIIVNLFSIFAQGYTADNILSDVFIYFIMLFLITIIGVFITYGLIHFFAKLFGGKSDFISFSKVLLYTNILNLMNIFAIFISDLEEVSVLEIVILVILLAFVVWSLFTQIKITKVVHQLTIWRAAGTVLIAFIILFSVIAVLGNLLLNLSGLI